MPNNSTLKMKMLALWEILQADSGEENPLATNEICRRLGERGIPCERKSVSTDVALLRKHGYGVETKKAGRTRYYWVNRQFRVPELTVLTGDPQEDVPVPEEKAEQANPAEKAPAAPDAADHLHLEKITYLNWHDVEDLRLTREQRHFIPGNLASLAQAYTIREAGFHVFPFGIYRGETPIGFLMIGYDIPYDPDDDRNEKYRFTRSSYFIWRFMIDKRYQGKGYGKESLQLALDFIRSAPCRKADYAWLCYAPENKVAKSLYASFGFEEVPEAYDPEDDEILAVLKL